MTAGQRFPSHPGCKTGDVKLTLTIGMTYDLRDDYLAEGYSLEQAAEFDSPGTIDAIESTLRGLGYRTVRIGHARALAGRLVAGERWDLVFNIAEGLAGRGREAQVPALLDVYGVPYTFSDPLVCAVTLDKAITKRLVASAGLKTPAFRLVADEGDVSADGLVFPLFAKPVAEGTGKGIDGRSRVDSPEQLAETCRHLLRKFRQPVLLEEFLPGREFTTGILGTGPAARVIGTMEVQIPGATDGAIYSLEIKETCETTCRYGPLEHGPLRQAVEKLALDSYRVLECRDAGRVDIRLDARGEPSFIEVNPLAGLHPTHSDLPMIATQEGMSYAELLGAIVTSALARTAATATTGAL